MLVQHLESRRLFSALVAGTSVLIDGTNKADVITVDLVQSDSGYAVSGSVNKQAFSFQLADLSLVQVRGLVGNDHIVLTDQQVSSNNLLQVDGGDGNDYIHVFVNNASLPLPFQNTGTPIIHGGRGGDTIVVAGSGYVQPVPVYGDGGNDIILGADATPINADGGAGNDIIVGGSGNDEISGGSGCNLLLGGAGNDLFHAGPGQDTFLGGDGDDTLIAYPRSLPKLGTDFYDGGAGNNTLVLGPGDVLPQFINVQNIRPTGWPVDPLAY